VERVGNENEDIETYFERGKTGNGRGKTYGTDNHRFLTHRHGEIHGVF
jgi:hypothetical protein